MNMCHRILERSVFRDYPENFEAIIGGNSEEMHVQKWTTNAQVSLMESCYIQIEINLQHKMMLLNGCFKVREVL